MDINGRIHKALGKPSVLFTLLAPSSTFGAWKNGYFPQADLLAEELKRYAPEPYVWCNPDWTDGFANVVIVACGGSPGDLEMLIELRERIGAEPVIALWLFDNHLGWIQNLNLAYAVDFVFFSHSYVSDYLFQPSSLNCFHIPACSVQWTTRQAEAYFSDREHEIRKNKLLINYVAYKSYSETRQRVLREYESGLECADVFLMPSTDRSRYDRLSPQSRFDEWLGYKATVIVPADRDVSTRVFDALLAGMILIVPSNIEDFDDVISPQMQTTLGIIRVDSLELSEIQDAGERALSLFDTLGSAGCRQRHEYALKEHMLVNRVTSMLYMLWLFGTQQAVVEYANDHAGPALYWKHGSTRS